MTIVIVLAVSVVAALYVISLYNNLVRLKHNVGKAWSNIEVLLRQRHDELPKLVEVCRQYMKYERETLEKVVQARGGIQSARDSGDLPALGRAEGALRIGLGELYAVVESYPELKADQTFQHLQARISGLEDSIADRREYYNESVNLNNIRIEQFPDLIIARWMNFKARDMLEFSREETRDSDLKTLFST